MKKKIERVCGPCTACCKTHGVTDISKPSGVWCSHRKMGEGCSIYPERPGQCSRFICQWLMGDGDDIERPDICGIVYDAQRVKFLGEVYLMYEIRKGSLQTWFARAKTLCMLENRKPVGHLFLDGAGKVYLPSRVGIPQHSFSIDEHKIELIPVATYITS